MSKEIVYWTMRDGTKISVDDMDINHLRNTLKMIIRNKARVLAATPVKPKFEIRGEIAQDLIDQGFLNELEEDMGLYDDPRDHWFEREI
jgi:hypothetical protein